MTLIEKALMSALHLECRKNWLPLTINQLSKNPCSLVIFLKIALFCFDYKIYIQMTIFDLEKVLTKKSSSAMFIFIFQITHGLPRLNKHYRP